MKNKELLSDILGVTISSINTGIPKGSNTIYVIYYTILDDYGTLHQINIYELAHKCKIWALGQKYQLHSALRTNSYPICICWNEETNKKVHFKSDTEFEAIFEATQWIYHNKGKI